MTFDDFVERHAVTLKERRDLVLYLAALRMRRTLEVLGTGQAPGKERG